MVLRYDLLINVPGAGLNGGSVSDPVTELHSGRTMHFAQAGGLAYVPDLSPLHTEHCGKAASVSPLQALFWVAMATGIYFSRCWMECFSLNHIQSEDFV